MGFFIGDKAGRTLASAWRRPQGKLGWDRSFLNVPQVILKYISLLRTGSLDQYFANLNMQMNQLGSWLNVGSDPVSVD